MTFEWVWDPRRWLWEARWPRERVVHFTSGRPAARFRTGRLLLGPLQIRYARRTEPRGVRT